MPSNKYRPLKGILYLAWCCTLLKVQARQYLTEMYNDDLLRVRVLCCVESLRVQGLHLYSCCRCVIVMRDRLVRRQ